MRQALRLFACSTIVLTGCSIGTIAKQAPAPAPDPTPLPSNTAIHGTLHGGQQAIAYAHIYLLAVGVNGYGGSSDSLLSGTGQSDSIGFYVSTNQNGAFTIPLADYNSTCSGKEAYLYSLGGNTLSKTQGPSNPFAGLMAVLGDCSNWQLPSSIELNEVTTVAAAYALAGYALPSTYNPGTPSTPRISRPNTSAAKAAVINAVANANSLVNLATGLARTSTPAAGSNGVVPQQEIHALASSLGACVNTSGAYTPPSPASPCYELMNDALSAGNSGSVPGDVSSAAINIAHFPGTVNVSDIFSMGTPQCCFSPTLSAAPNDWTIAVVYGDTSFNGPQELAIDGSDNVWMTTDSGVVKMSPQGAILSGSGYTGGGLSQPVGIAIDSTGNVWIANSGNHSITELVPGSGNSVTATGHTNASLSIPWGVAVDAGNNVWVTDRGLNQLSEFSAGSFVYTSSSGAGGLSGPAGVAVDASGNIWVGNPDGLAGDTVSLFHPASPGATPDSHSPFTIGDGSQAASPDNVAIDAAGNIWFADYGNSTAQFPSVAKFPLGSTPATTYNGGGISGPDGGAYGIAVDGAGLVWTANFGPGGDPPSAAGSISALQSNGTPLSPSNGYQPVYHQLLAVAIDSSGDVWVTDNADGKLIELVGAATPVATPINPATPAAKP